MVKEFIFNKTPKIFFGPGKIKLLPDLAGKLGSSLLLLRGEGPIYDTNAGKEVINILKSNKFVYNEAVVLTEPSPQIIDSIVSSFKNSNIEVVIGIGGGSVIDAGKAVSAMLPLQEPVMNFLEGVGCKEHPGLKLPYIAIPTTSGTGSEVTKNAVLSEIGTDGFKKSLRHDCFAPDIAIVDPQLTMTCPPNITAFSGMDAFTQLLESYLSVKSNIITDALAFEGLKRIKNSILPVYLEGDKNLDARSSMSFAAMLSGLTLANAGLGVVHGFALKFGMHVPFDFE